MSFCKTKALFKDCRYHIFGQYLYTRNVPVFTSAYWDVPVSGTKIASFPIWLVWHIWSDELKLNIIFLGLHTLTLWISQFASQLKHAQNWFNLLSLQLYQHFYWCCRQIASVKLVQLLLCNGKRDVLIRLWYSDLNIAIVNKILDVHLKRGGGTIRVTKELYQWGASLHKFASTAGAPTPCPFPSSTLTSKDYSNVTLTLNCQCLFNMFNVPQKLRNIWETILGSQSLLWILSWNVIRGTLTCTARPGNAPYWKEGRTDTAYNELPGMMQTVTPLETSKGERIMTFILSLIPVVLQWEGEGNQKCPLESWKICYIIGFSGNYPVASTFNPSIIIEAFQYFTHIFKTLTFRRGKKNGPASFMRIYEWE